MKKINNSGFTIIAALLILVTFGIIGGVGYYIWSQQEGSQNGSNSQVTNKNNESVSTKNEETGAIPKEWVEYKNEEYGFSFYYPKEYELTFEDIYTKADGSSIANIKVPGIGVTIVNEPDNSNDGVKNGIGFSVVRESDNIGNSYEDLTNPELKNIVKDLKKVEINSNSGFQYRWLGESDPKSYLYNDNSLDTVFESNSYVYRMTYSYPYDGNTDKYIEIYNGMLNSLVLTNPE